MRRAPAGTDLPYISQPRNTFYIHGKANESGDDFIKEVYLLSMHIADMYEREENKEIAHFSLFEAHRAGSEERFLGSLPSRQGSPYWISITAANVNRNGGRTTYPMRLSGKARAPD